MSYNTTTKISAWGGSNGMRIPKEAIAILGLSNGDLVELEITGEKMIIKKKRKSLRERFDSFDGEYQYAPEDESWVNMERTGGEIL